jgi:hypothetical protein
VREPDSLATGPREAATMEVMSLLLARYTCDAELTTYKQVSVPEHAAPLCHGPELTEGRWMAEVGVCLLEASGALHANWQLV